MSKTVIILLIGNAFLGAANLGIVSYLTSAAVFSKKMWTYLLLVVGFFALLGGMVSMIPSASLGFVVFETGALILGIVFLLTAYQRFSTWLLRKDFAPGFWLCVALMFFGMVGFILTYSIISPKNEILTPYLAMGALRFLLPYLFLKSYDFWQEIPPLIYRKWYSSGASKIPMMELRNTVRVKMRIFKTPQQTTWEGHEFEAPQERMLGEWVQYMINLYNTKIDPQNPILTEDTDSAKPVGWVFYKTSFWGLWKSYLDPNQTFIQNNIAANTVIVMRGYKD